ncbi:hypothetical protein Q5H92_26335 [Hymenobacter sp. M29]|uniref:Uncharacterized protein n=1 Tax=Hymenobacter mellowenesis TaxID=3063995 RepID=A0ABT9AKR6_9BACT|nr:hypothetical protein [Hymenobacter sp. M29]MDO7849905.1 hypothetical protein [Hymenobacter sp. M29]
MGVQLPSVLALFRSPIKAQIIFSELTENQILSVSTFKVRNKTVYVLFHSALGKLGNASMGTLKFSQLAMENISSMRLAGDTTISRQINTITCFFFKEESAKNVAPIELFFRGLNKYAQTATINQESKKFFHSGRISTLLFNSDRIELLQQQLGIEGEVAGYINFNKTSAGYEYENLYFLYADRMKADYARHDFQ